MKPKSIAIAILLTSLLTGCVGAGPVLTQTLSTERSDGGNRWICPDEKVGDTKKCDTESTPGTFVKAWGKPNGRSNDGSIEVLKYNTDIAWRGFVAFLVVPLPALVPVGHNQLSLTFYDGKLVKIEQEHGEMHAAVCGLQKIETTGWGCSIFH